VTISINIYFIDRKSHILQDTRKYAVKIDGLFQTKRRKSRQQIFSASIHLPFEDRECLFLVSSQQEAKQDVRAAAVRRKRAHQTSFMSSPLFDPCFFMLYIFAYHLGFVYMNMTSSS